MNEQQCRMAILILQLGAVVVGMVSFCLGVLLGRHIERHNWAAAPAVPPPPPEPLWFVEAGCDGHTGEIVRDSELHDYVHQQMCVCGKRWHECQTEGVTEAAKSLADDEMWVSEHGKHFKWRYDMEGDYIHVTRITQNGVAHE